MFRVILVAAATLTLVGCASAPVSPERIQASENVIQDAVSAGAERDPNAAKYLELARGEIDSGKKLSANGDAKQAESLLEKAEADARLANATAQQSASAAAVKQAAAELKKINEGGR
jgi:hypothetical protein